MAKPIKFKLKLFERGASAYRRLSGDERELYVCPVCLRFLDREAISRGDLTLEHVPPESIGGKGICLTCRDCNSRAGFTVDAARAELERMRSLNHAIATQVGQFSGPIKLTVGDAIVNATVEVDGKQMTFHVHEERNNPANLAKQNAYLEELVRSKEPNYKIGVTASFKLRRRYALVSVLRSAYLAAFALLGYSYIMQSQLTVVRDQIARPDEEIVPVPALQVLNDGDAPPEPMIFDVTEPVGAVGIFLRPVMVLLPPVGGRGDFYAELVEAIRVGRKLSASAMAWPTGLQLAMELRDT